MKLETPNPKTQEIRKWIEVKIKSEWAIPLDHIEIKNDIPIFTKEQAARYSAARIVTGTFTPDHNEVPIHVSVKIGPSISADPYPHFPPTIPVPEMDQEELKAVMEKVTYIRTPILSEEALPVLGAPKILPIDRGLEADLRTHGIINTTYRNIETAMETLSKVASEQYPPLSLIHTLTDTMTTILQDAGFPGTRCLYQSYYHRIHIYDYPELKWYQFKKRIKLEAAITKIQSKLPAGIPLFDSKKDTYIPN